MKRNYFLLSLCLAATATSFALSQSPRKKIYVNPDVTTHILMPENLKLVDISTEDIVGNQCADNMIRIKPVELDSLGDIQNYMPGQFLGTVTMIGERHVVQYDVVYEPIPANADAFYKVSYDESYNYTNPETKMPESEMARLAWSVYASKRKFHTIREKQYGIKGEVYNIYTIGDYFFIDFKLTNLTNIPYDIAEIKVSLSDKKQTKATNFQTIELTPRFVLNNADHFNKDYRQVIVLDKLTFPDEKVLNIEVSEDQISGRVITMSIQYDDILHADVLNKDKIEKELNVVRNSKALEAAYQDRETKIQKKNDRLQRANLELKNDLYNVRLELEEVKKQLKEKGKESKEPTINVNSKKHNADSKYIYTETLSTEDMVE